MLIVGWEFLSTFIQFFFPMSDIVETPIDIVVIIVLFFFVNKWAVILLVELIPFVDLFPTYLVFLGIIFLEFYLKKTGVIEKGIKKFCSICTEKILQDLFQCPFCLTYYHQHCFFEYARTRDCPKCLTPLKDIIEKINEEPDRY